jgi:membrane dipeptidase
MEKKIPLFDNHCDTLVAVRRTNRDWVSKSQDGHWDAERYLKVNGKYQVMAIFSSTHLIGDTATSFVLEVLGDYYNRIKTTDKIQTIKTKEDLALCGDKLGVILAIEGATPLKGKESILELLFQAGIRLITLSWNHRNELADGIKVGGNYGLTDIGKTLVSSMHEKGIAVDISHLSEAGFWDTSKILKSGMIASHSNAYEICNHPRNLKDEQIKAISDRNGVIGFNFASRFICSEGKPGKDDFLAHLKHIKKIGGSKVLALGGDLDGISSGLILNASDFPIIIKWASEILNDEELEDFAWKNSYNFFKNILPNA